MTTIILADSDDAARGELISRLTSAQPDWHIIDLSGGLDVLQRMSEDTISCVITEVDLHDMSGFELLSKLQANYPDVVRITLSADLDQESVLESTRVNHRFINRAVSTEVLISTIASSLRLQEVLGGENLKRTMNEIGSLPSLPEIYQRMVNELSSSQSSLLNVSKIIESDSALTATVLKIVNSAFYGLNQRVESVSQGVALLGVHLIKNVTLTAKVFAEYKGGEQQLSKLRQLNDNANKNGALTNQFARLAHVPRSVVDHAQIAGMLSNIGELVQLSKSTDDTPELSEADSNLQGAYLLKLWMLPDPIVEAVALQHESPPRATAALTPLIILHAVRYLEAHFVDLTDNSQRTACQAYLEELVSPAIATSWMNAYCDMHTLTEDDAADQSRVA